MTRPATSSVERLAEEYRALRDAAAVVDLTGWTVLEITGPETRDFLQGTATQDFVTPPAPAASPGAASRALFLTEKGRPMALAWISSAADGATATVIADESARVTLRAHFERFRVMEDVEFEGPEGMPRIYGVAEPGPDSRSAPRPPVRRSSPCRTRSPRED